ncbi:DUF4097 family beta strand repeat protein [Mycoplasmatota bacterium]|nr:DUF4097 family beta strand repeat protein [Mycoplasmatota bacterium]
MTKKEYLRKLDEELILLDEEIADDILDYYRSRFDEEKRFENKTDEEIIKSLGDPFDLAKRIYSSYGIKPEKWESARNDDINTVRAVLVLMFDVFVASWLIPLLVFLSLSVFATFVTFPFVIATLPSFGINDIILIIVLAFGVYSLLILLILGLVEISIIVIRNILIMNVKVLSPRNKTTSRLIKRVSLFEWMRRMKMGRNVFINLGMIAISLVAISFLIITTVDNDILSTIGAQPTIKNTFPEDLSEEIIEEEAYSIKIDVGDLDINLVRNLSTELQITHEYNMDDLFKYSVDYENNKIDIKTYEDKLNGGFFGVYEGVLTVSVPADLLINEIDIDAGESDIEMFHYDSDVLDIEIDSGDINMYKVDVQEATITSDEGNINLLDSWAVELSITVDDGFIFLSDIDSYLRLGEKLNITNSEGDITLESVYFKDIVIDNPLGDFHFRNFNEFYEIENLEVKSIEGEVIVEPPVKNRKPDQG